MPDPQIRFRPASFKPSWWLPGAHAHTVAGRFIRPLDAAPPEQRRVELPDGDFVDLHLDPPPADPNHPAVLILHGLEGCYLSNYVANQALQLRNLGIRAVRMNFRGCSGEMNRAPRFYHAGDTADLDHILAVIGEDYPPDRLGAIGFSLGGNVLLKYLGELGEAAGTRLHSAAAVSVPFDLAAGTRQLERPGMSWLYMIYFMRKLRRKARLKRAILADHCDVDRAIGSRTIRGYDDALTSRLHGFAGSWDYYQQCSSAGIISGIRIPTLVLHAMDDPFLPSDSVPLDAIRSNPWIVDATTPLGGHVGFISGPPWSPRFWAEDEAARFFQEQLGTVESDSLDGPHQTGKTIGRA